MTSWKINGVEKKCGEIIDYYNVFRNMRKALKDYAQGQEGQDEPPVREKRELLKLLDDAIAQGMAFCRGKTIYLDDMMKGQDVFKNVSQFEAYADKLLSKDEWRKEFVVYENTITSLYEACKPEILGSPVVRSVAAFQYLRGVVDSIIGQKDMDAASLRVGQLLDESLVVAGAEHLKEGKPEFRIARAMVCINV